MDEMSDGERAWWRAKWVELVTHGEVVCPAGYEPLTRLRALVAGMPQTVMLTPHEWGELAYDLWAIEKKFIGWPSDIPSLTMTMSLEANPNTYNGDDFVPLLIPSLTRVVIAPA